MTDDPLAFVNNLRNELNAVRDEISACWDKMWGTPGKMPNPTERMQYENKVAPLEAREQELQNELSKYIWLLPEPK